MSDVAVIYNGPAGAYHVEDPGSGKWFELVRGARIDVPDSLAETLIDLDDHDVNFADDLPEPDEVSDPPEPHDPADPDDDPKGSTRDLPNFGGS